MKILRDHRELSEQISVWKQEKARVGFVPTMGALHSGHASLVNFAQDHCDRVVASIFVNPTQFNNPEDLKKYPRTESEDLQMLEDLGCHLVYLPEVTDIYPQGYSQPHFDLGSIESVMEGEHRPGHFQGVAAVLDRFFSLVTPDLAFFGEKDFQQVAVVRRLVELLKIDLSIVACPTVREESGLAKSSRNKRLSPQAFENASFIYKGLSSLQSSVKDHFDPIDLKEMERAWNQEDSALTEYLQLCNEQTFVPAVKGQDLTQGRWRLFTAVQVEGVRLIDNVPLRP